MISILKVTGDNLTEEEKSSTATNIEKPIDVKVMPESPLNDEQVQFMSTISQLFPAGSIIKEASGNANQFLCTILYSANTKEKFYEWLQYHSFLSGVIYRNEKSISNSKCGYYSLYTCEEAALQPNLELKCQGSLRVNIKSHKPNSDSSRLPAVIHVRFCHNHQIVKLASEKEIAKDPILFSYINTLFPMDTLVVSATPLGKDLNTFSCVLRTKAKTKDEFKSWLSQHCSITGMEYRQKCAAYITKKFLYDAKFLCIYSRYLTKTYGPELPSRKKHCDSILRVTISNNKFCNTHPCVIKVVFSHQPTCRFIDSGIKPSPKKKIDPPPDKIKPPRPKPKPPVSKVKSPTAKTVDLDSATANVDQQPAVDVEPQTAQMKPSEETNEKFKLLFRNGVEVSNALKLFLDIQKEEQQNFDENKAFLNTQWVNSLHESLFSRKRNRFDEMADKLLDKISQLNIAQKELVASVRVLECDKDVVFAVCTKFMKRVHSLSSSGEIVYVDSAGNSDQMEFRTYCLMCDSCVGGLPLGVVVTTSDSMVAVSLGFETLMKLFPPHAFGGKGLEGPAMFMTEINQSVEKSLRRCYSNSIILYTSFHLLQQSWSKITNPNNKVLIKDRRDLVDHTLRLVHSSNYVEAVEHHLDDVTNKTLKRYPTQAKYLDLVFNCRDKWAQFYLREFNREEDYLKSLVKSAVRVLHDRIFRRCITFCVVEHLNFVSSGLDNYFIRKMAHYVGIDKNNYRQSKYLCDLPIENYFVVQLSDFEYEVGCTKSDKKYVVNVEIGYCECAAGPYGVPCSHQEVVRETVMTFFEGIPEIQYSKEELYYTAVGPPDQIKTEKSESLPVESEVTIVEDHSKTKNVQCVDLICSDEEEMTNNEDEEDVDTFLNRTTARLTEKVKHLFENERRSGLKDAWLRFTDEAVKCETSSELACFFQRFTLPKQCFQSARVVLEALPKSSFVNMNSVSTQTIKEETEEAYILQTAEMDFEYVNEEPIEDESLTPQLPQINSENSVQHDHIYYVIMNKTEPTEKTELDSVQQHVTEETELQT